MSPPSFLDKLAPELRVQIYGHIFGTSNTIKPSDSTASLGIDKSELNPAAHIANPQMPLESSILATNKLIFREAIQVLYHNRVIRVTLIDLKHLLQDKDFVANVENVEIADCVNGMKSVNLSGILNKLQELPRIGSIVILSRSGQFENRADCRLSTTLRRVYGWTWSCYLHRYRTVPS
jgi:hypothetical protein